MSSRRKQACSRPEDIGSSGLDAIIRAYQLRCEARAVAELKTFADEPTLDAAIRRAALARRTDGKRYDHQRRLSRWTLQAMLTQLQEAPLAGCRSFHELYQVIGRAIGPVPGVGDLTIYDTALRIGAKLDLQPERVYLHAGTRAGARRLGLDWHAPFVQVKDLPPPLRRLPAHEVEDILCIFKDRLG